jgi:hypothetical protein
MVSRLAKACIRTSGRSREAPTALRSCIMAMNRGDRVSRPRARAKTGSWEASTVFRPCKMPMNPVFCLRTASPRSGGGSWEAPLPACGRCVWPVTLRSIRTRKLQEAGFCSLFVSLNIETSYLEVSTAFRPCIMPMNRRERSTFNGKPSTINRPTINRFMRRHTWKEKGRA